MNKDVSTLPWEGVSLEEVLNLFMDYIHDFPCTEIADGAPMVTDVLPCELAPGQVPTLIPPLADPNSELPVSNKVYVLLGDGH
jgi:hypothetical protein